MESKKPLTYASIAIVIAVLAAVIGLMALNEKGLDNGENTLSRIQSAGEMNVCYSAYPPAIIKDNNTGELSGHDVDLIEAITSEIDVEPVFVENAWGTMVSALQSGRCDVVPSYFAQIPRAASVAFTDPYYYIGQGVVAREGDDRFQDLSDLNSNDVTIVVANGESGHNYAKEHFPNAELVVINVEGADLSRVFTEVVSGRVDVGVGDAETVKRFIAANPETYNPFANRPFGLNPVGLAVRQDDGRFLQFLNTTLRYLEVNGRIQEFEDKYDADRLHQVREYGIQ